MNLMSYEEIVKCLECCIHTECSSCPLRREIACLGILRDNVYKLIKQQKEEIDNTKEDCNRLKRILKEKQ